METRLAIDSWRDLDFRLASDGDGLRFSGYAAVFDSASEDLGGFTEIIAPGAFKRSLGQRKDDIKMFLNHNWDILLASRKAGSLQLKEDAYGLHVDAEFVDTAEARNVSALVQRGDIHAMSFGFQPVTSDSEEGGKRVVQRELKLYEVSPVTAWPAYRATSASVRHLADLVQVDEDTITSALRVLTSADGVLTDEQRDLLTRAISARSPVPVGTPLRDAYMERLAQLAA
jgi:HK97 family phage prohead protease